MCRIENTNVSTLFTTSEDKSTITLTVQILITLNADGTIITTLFFTPKEDFRHFDLLYRVPLPGEFRNVLNTSRDCKIVFSGV